MVNRRTSYTHPLRIDVVKSPDIPGNIGMTLCPGKTGISSFFKGEWNRDLKVDMAMIKAWDPRAVVCLLENHELSSLGVNGLPDAVIESGIEWYQLPIRDGHTPDEAFELLWQQTGQALAGYLERGDRVLIHCRGGLGRTGTVAAKLLVESGVEPAKAINLVRKARKGAIETTKQYSYVTALTNILGPETASVRLLELMRNVKSGTPQGNGYISVMPLFIDSPGTIDYRTTGEAMDSGEFSVTEIDGDGSVPRLQADNRGGSKVLMVGGEELVGCKQNRIINTTILLPANTSLEIPVSCTEQGRWSSSSTRFSDSPVFMPRESRLNSKRSVDRTLSNHGSYEGDQANVWDDITLMAQKSGTASQTGAMRDIVGDNWDRISCSMEGFSPVDGQKGMAIYIDEVLAGIEIVSTPAALRSLFPKILGSYAADAVINREERFRSEIRPSLDDFLRTVPTSRCTTFPSVGVGTDLRFENDLVSGSALVYQNEIVHLSAYATNPIN